MPWTYTPKVLPESDHPRFLSCDISRPATTKTRPRPGFSKGGPVFDSKSRTTPAQPPSVMSEEEVEDSIVAYTSDDERLIDPDTDGDRECVVTKWISKIKTEPSHRDNALKAPAIPSRLTAYGGTLQTGIIIPDSEDDMSSLSSRQRTTSQDILPKPIPKKSPPPHRPPTERSHPLTGRQDIANMDNQRISIAANGYGNPYNHKVPGPTPANSGDLQPNTNENHPRDSKKRAPGSPTPNSREPKLKRVATDQSFQSNHKQRPDTPSMGTLSGRVSLGASHKTPAKQYLRPFTKSVPGKTSGLSFKGTTHSRHRSSSPSYILKKIGRDRQKFVKPQSTGLAEQRNDTTRLPVLPTWEDSIHTFKDDEDVVARQKMEMDRRKTLEKDLLFANSKIADLASIRDKLVAFSKTELSLIEIFRPLERLSVDQSNHLSEATSRLVTSPDDPPAKLYNAISMIQIVVKTILREIHNDHLRAIEGLDEEQATLKTEKAQLQTHYNALQLRVDTLQKAALSRQKIDDQRDAEKASTAKNHTKALRDVEQSLRREIRDIIGEKDQEITSANAKRTEIEKTVTELQEDLRTMASHLETQTKLLEDHKSGSDNEKRELMADREKLHTQSAELSQALSLLKLTHDFQKSEFDKLKKDHQELATKNQDLIAKNLGLTQHEDELERQKAEMETKITDLEATLREKLQMEETTMIAEQATFQIQQASQHKDEIQEKNKVISDLQQERAALEAKLAAQNDDLKVFRNKSENYKAHTDNIASICMNGAAYFGRSVQLPSIHELPSQVMPSQSLPPILLEQPTSTYPRTPAQQGARNLMPPPPSPVQVNASSHPSSGKLAQQRRKLPSERRLSAE